MEDELERQATRQETDAESTQAPMDIVAIHVSGVPALSFRKGSGCDGIDIGDPGGELVMVRIRRGLKKPIFFMAHPQLLVTEYVVQPVIIAKSMPRVNIS